MTAQYHSDHPETDSSGPDPSIGGRLRAARLDRGLDLERIASQLHLQPGLVDALEAGRYQELPDPVFILGYIRNYARLLDLDPEPLVAAYRSATGQPLPARPRVQGGVPPEHRGGGVLVRLTSVAVVAGLAYLFAQWWQGQAPGQPELNGAAGVAVEAQSPGPARDLDRPRAGAASSTPANTQAGTQAGTPADTAPARREPVAVAPVPTALAAVPPAHTAAPAIAAAPAPEPPAEPPAEPQASPEPGSPETAAAGPAAASQPDEVVLEFHGPTWVDVRDSAKSFSLTGSMTKGDRRVLGGTPPYTFVIGKASSVALSVRGAPFDLNRVAKGNVARFKLDPAKLP